MLFENCNTGWKQHTCVHAGQPGFIFQKSLFSLKTVILLYFIFKETVLQEMKILSFTHPHIDLTQKIYFEGCW